jgi:hypothetical protein
MKLPEYDNRPGPGTPLYSDPKAGEGDFKYPALIFLLIVGFIVCFAILGYGLYDLLSHLGRLLFH